MMILAPMHPVMLVFGLDETEGPEPLPEELERFSQFQGEWQPIRLQRTIENATVRDHILIETLKLSKTNSGHATLAREEGKMKLRIAMHEGLDEASRYGVLLHELAHVYLGHLGGDVEGQWPSRGDIGRNAAEIEAEAVAYIVSRRAGLRGSSDRYISRHMANPDALAPVSPDQIAKVAGRLEAMGDRLMKPRRQTISNNKR